MNDRTQRLERQYQDQQKRVRALMGIDEPANPKHAELRQALTEIMPELGLLGKNPKALEKVLELMESGRLDSFEQSDQAGWRRHAMSMTQMAVDTYEKAAGLAAGSAPPRAIQRMARALQDFVEEDRSGERQSRYEMGDPTLIKECIEDLSGFFVKPIRALGQQHGARLTDQNRRLPSQGPRGGVPPAGPPRKMTRAEKSQAAREYVLNGDE